MTEQGFVGVFAGTVRDEQLQELCQSHAPTSRRPPERSAMQVVRDLEFHQLLPDGTLAAHGAMLGGESISDQAYTQRRERLPQALFTDLLTAGLAPLAQPDQHPDAFYRGWRLVGVDSTEVT